MSLLVETIHERLFLMQLLKHQQLPVILSQYLFILEHKKEAMRWHSQSPLFSVSWWYFCGVLFRNESFFICDARSFMSIEVNLPSITYIFFVAQLCELVILWCSMFFPVWITSVKDWHETLFLVSGLLNWRWLVIQLIISFLPCISLRAHVSTCRCWSSIRFAGFTVSWSDWLCLCFLSLGFS